MSELYIPTERPTRSKVNGQFLKGHVPANKGKTWDEFMSKRGQRKARKGWKNLEIGHAKGRPHDYNAGRCRKPLIGITDDGKVHFFSYSVPAATWVNGERGNVNRCARLNSTSKKNTDHKYKGVRWYFENSNVWIKKSKSV